MTLYPNCKINIGLNVVEKRPDGYHNIETLFYPIHGLKDRLTIERDDESADGISLTTTNIAIDCADENNLIVRCYRRMKSLFPQIGAVRAVLEKNIPFGAGLGGGSSDAAHTAVALNSLFDLGLSPDRLADIVKPLGADCPFFIYNTPCLAYGIGDDLHPVDFSLSCKRLIMIKPPVGVSTKEAYAGLTPSHRHLISRETLSGWHSYTNDFEQSVFARLPLLGKVKDCMLKAGAEYAAMSGSGSTVFGIFESDADSGADTYLRMFDEDFASMVIFNDTL